MTLYTCLESSFLAEWHMEGLGGVHVNLNKLEEIFRRFRVRVRVRYAHERNLMKKVVSLPDTIETNTSHRNCLRNLKI